MRPMQEATNRPGATDAPSLWLGVNIKGWLGWVNKRHSSSTVVIVFLRCPPLHVWAVTWEYTFSSFSQKVLNKKQTGIKKRTKLFRWRNVRFNKRFYFFFFPLSYNLKKKTKKKLYNNHICSSRETIFKKNACFSISWKEKGKKISILIFIFVNCMFGFAWICPHCLTFRMVGIFGMVKDTITVNFGWYFFFFSLVW